MGKGGAPTTTATTQNQNVAYTPTGLQGFQDIYNRASQVASQPYQPYGGQLVQGLTPTQTGAIGNITNIANNPLSQGQIQQYMNPYQSDVINATMANINETNQQQQAQTTGQLTQAAGGIGADRIALGQGELARQQALASNQTLAGLNQQNYAQGLAAAQQQQGFGLGAAQTQLGAGGLEQQTGQAGLTAQYQQYLQQLAFPYQQAQFLAGIGLPSLGAMGGQQYQTGTANQTMTPPGMSWLQGLTGAGALGLGAYQSGLFGGSGGSAYPITQGVTDPTAGQARGGRVYADGGDVDEEEALAPVLDASSYVPQASSPQANEKMPSPLPPMQTGNQGQNTGGSGSTLGTLASIGTTAAKIIPFLAALKTGGRAPHYDDGGTVPMQGSGMGANAYPTPGMLGSPITKGALPQSPQMSSPNVFYGRQLPNMLPPSPVTGGMQAGQNMYEMARQALQQQQIAQAMSAMRSRASNQPEVGISAQEYASGGYADGGDIDDLPDPDIMDRVNNLPNVSPYAPGNWAVQNRFPTDMPPAQTRSVGMGPEDFSFMNVDAAQNPGAYLGDAATKGDRLDRITPYPTDEQMTRARQALAAGMTPRGQPTDISGDSPYPRTQTGAGFDPATASPRDIMNLDNYKDQVAQRPTVRGLMNNPDFWMRTGLNILSANPQHGAISAIASGAGATVGEYDKWSKEDLSSKQKAEELAGKLMQHAQQYTRLTANERAHLSLEQEKLNEQKDWHQKILPQRTDSQDAARAVQLMGKDVTGQMSFEEALARIRAAKVAQGANQPAAPARPTGVSDEDIIAQARAAVQKNPASADAVKQRLTAWGIDTSGM